MSRSSPHSSSSRRGRKPKGKFSSFDEVVKELRDRAATFPDARNPNASAYRYSMEDCTASAFSVFYFQHSSFLDAQRKLQNKTHRNNAQTLFGIEQIPSDPHIRKCLDPVDPSLLAPLIFGIGESLFQQGHLSPYYTRFGFLPTLDGTQTVSSDKISCPSCLKRKKAKDSEEVTYSHAAVTPVLVRPGESSVIPLPPEFIGRDDGTSKQDCEICAGTRWIESYLPRYREFGRITVMGDDLYSHEPFCRKVLELGCDFLFVCKESSHKTLSEYLKGCTTVVLKRHEKGVRKKKRLLHTYRFMNGTPLSGQEDALRVNWFSLEITDEDSGERIFYNSWATSHTITPEILEDLSACARSRWHIENGNNNPLKTKGYHLSHNFGHGEVFLSNTLTTLNILAFLLHRAQEFWDAGYCTARSLMPRIAFFDILRVLTSFAVFPSFDRLIEFLLEDDPDLRRLILDTS